MGRNALHSEAESKMVPVLARVVCSIHPTPVIVAEKGRKDHPIHGIRRDWSFRHHQSEFQGWKSRRN